jgi:ATP-dependent 26S proteasome regulatory subunit
MAPPITQSKFIRELGFHVRASYPFLYVVTDEPHRLKKEAQVLADTYLSKESNGTSKFSVHHWSITEGWSCKGKRIPMKSEDGEVAPNNPNAAFAMIRDLPPFSIFIMENFHFFLTDQNPELIQLVSDMSQHCNQKGKTIVFMNPVQKIPTEIEAQITVLHHDLPTTDDINNAIDRTADIVNGKGVKLDLSEENRYVLLEALKGMRLSDVDNSLAYSLVTTKTFDPKVLLAEKCKSLKKAGMLEFIQTSETFDKIGGLENVKKWIQDRHIAFTAKAKKYNLRPSKGIILVGVPGCGKSLIAKASAATLGCPLIRFDMAGMFSKYVGESEQRAKKAFKTVDAIERCVLWIDEIEKGMGAGGGGGGEKSQSLDGGVSSRVFGTFLEWLNEHTTPVFVIATSNNLDAIPIEFTRKGRFDEIFFVDIPNTVERTDIVKIQLTRQKLDQSKYDIAKLVDASNQFTGAEIERAIDEAKIRSANLDRIPTTDDIIECAGEIVPEAKKNKSRIEQIRAKAANIAIPASREEKVTPKQVTVGGETFRSIET